MKYWRVERDGLSALRDCFAGALDGLDWGFGSPASFVSGNTGIGWECLKASFKERFRTVAFIILKFLILPNLNRYAAQADPVDPGGVLCGIQLCLQILCHRKNAGVTGCYRCALRRVCAKLEKGGAGFARGELVDGPQSAFAIRANRYVERAKHAKREIHAIRAKDAKHALHALNSGDVFCKVDEKSYIAK